MDKIFVILRNIVSGLNIDSGIKDAINSRLLLGGFTKESVIKLKNCSVQLTTRDMNRVQQLIKLAIKNSDYDDGLKNLLQRAVSYLSRKHLQKYNEESALLKKYCQFFALLLSEELTIEEVNSIAYCNPIFFIEELSEVFSEIDINSIVFDKLRDIGPDYDSIYENVMRRKVIALSNCLTDSTINAIRTFPITDEVMLNLNNVTLDTKGLELIIDNILPDSFRNLYRLYFGFTSDKKPRELDEIKDALEYESMEEVKDVMSTAYNIINALLLTSNLPPNVRAYIQANFKYVEFPPSQEKVSDYVNNIKTYLILGNYEFDDNFKSVISNHLNELLSTGAIEKRVYDYISGILNMKTMVDEDSEILIELFIRAYRYYLHNHNRVYSPYMGKIVTSSKDGFGAL